MLSRETFAHYVMRRGALWTSVWATLVGTPSSTNSGTNNLERSAFFQSEVVCRFLEHTTSDLRFHCVSGWSVE